MDKWDNWIPEVGYLTDPTVLNSNFSKEELPRRTSAPGLTMGLTVILDVQEEEYFCSGTESVGFKTLFHTPTSSPEMVDYGFALTPGTESFISISPEYIDTSEKIHHIETDIRQCYLEHERHLHYYQHYTYLNCFMECISNYTIKVIHYLILFPQLGKNPQQSAIILIIRLIF